VDANPAGSASFCRIQFGIGIQGLSPEPEPDL
jgi:hypothetical protein